MRAESVSMIQPEKRQANLVRIPTGYQQSTCIPLTRVKIPTDYRIPQTPAAYPRHLSRCLQGTWIPLTPAGIPVE